MFAAALFPMLGQWDKKERNYMANRKDTGKLWWKQIQPLKMCMKTHAMEKYLGYNIN